MKERRLTSAEISSYGDSLRREERAAATVDKYLRDVRAFALWLDGRPVTKETAAVWKSVLTERGYASATVNAKLSTLNGLFRSLGWEECRVKFLKVQRRVQRPWPQARGSRTQ